MTRLDHPGRFTPEARARKAVALAETRTLAHLRRLRAAAPLVLVYVPELSRDGTEARAIRGW